jgi:transposase
MKYVGIDLHKKTISGCVVVKERGRKKIAARKRLECRDEAGIKSWFSELGKFEVVVEATASYEWFVKLVEPLAHRVVLAHPKKLRIIAESKRKSDKLDAQVLAEFLASDEIPLAYRPGPRVREHRMLVRWRNYIQRRITSVKNKLRHILASYNADVPHLFTAEGRAHLATVKLSAADRFVAEQLVVELEQHQERLVTANRRLREFAASAPLAEREARAILDSIPNVGPVTTDVILAELGDWRRFHSAGRCGLLRRPGAGLSRKRRQSQATGDHQGRLTAAQVGHDRVGLANGRHQPQMGRTLSPLGSPRRREEGDRSDRSAVVRCDLCAAQNGAEVFAGLGESTTGILPEQIAERHQSKRSVLPSRPTPAGQLAWSRG